jgi:hypothetical protein
MGNLELGIDSRVFSMQSISNIILRFIYLFPKKKDKLRATDAHSQKDHIAKAFSRA